ncbi:hypothetical protein J7384_11305 [Endozoicomonas sp. G2_1]|uniref:hypothetical protein n=1 Tax=Endozoicomonas sp. G2_1 TaxID=2821091 RepID=UPI001ADB56D6|nr:hypothetical protein [Endozoicomonas sp. G2_1]MBO9490946.1 hypothetical protein [Endozoicomonas sp. G2_1]
MNKLIAQKTLLLSILTVFLLTLAPASNATVGGKRVPPMAQQAAQQDNSWWQDLLFYFNLNG